MCQFSRFCMITKKWPITKQSAKNAKIGFDLWKILYQSVNWLRLFPKRHFMWDLSRSNRFEKFDLMGRVQQNFISSFWTSSFFCYSAHLKICIVNMFQNLLVKLNGIFCEKWCPQANMFFWATGLVKLTSDWKLIFIRKFISTEIIKFIYDA